MPGGARSIRRGADPASGGPLDSTFGDDAAKQVDPFQLLDRLRARLDEPGIGDHQRRALRAGQGNVEPIRVEQESEAPGRAVCVARAHADDDDRGLLALESVDRPDAYGGRQDSPQSLHLQVVRGDDEDALMPETTGPKNPLKDAKELEA